MKIEILSDDMRFMGDVDLDNTQWRLVGNKFTPVTKLSIPVEESGVPKYYRFRDRYSVSDLGRIKYDPPFVDTNNNLVVGDMFYISLREFQFDDLASLSRLQEPDTRSVRSACSSLRRPRRAASQSRSVSSRSASPCLAMT